MAAKKSNEKKDALAKNDKEKNGQNVKSSVPKANARSTSKIASRRISARKGGIDASLETAELSSLVMPEIQVEYLLKARKFALQKSIHPRKEIPEVPQGDKISDDNPSPPLALEMPRDLALAAVMGEAQPLANTDEITLVRNVQLDDVSTADTASHVCEPSVATNGDVVFMTGNWFAAVSVDGGQTFRFVNPFNTFPDPPGSRFCCDQIVHYIKKIDTFVWLLQYVKDPNGENIQRLAFATTADVRQGRWRIFDISSQSLGLAGRWLDFPDLAVGSNMLYLTSNAFNVNAWAATVLVRLQLSGIQSGNITAQRTVSTTHFNFRVAQNCTTRCFFASHNSTSSLRIFSWGETEAQPTFRDVTVPTWTRGAFVSKTPDNRNWLARSDSRIVGGTKSGGTLWFAWASNAGGANNRPNPFVQIARINATAFNLIESINLWDATSAICFAALATNTRNEVGTSYMIGGGGRFPTHVVGILTGTRKEVMTFQSVRGPSDEKYGDYLTIRRHSPNGKLFSATGYTLQTGSGSADAVPNFTIFGRSSDV